MATGKLPFEGETQGSVFDSILNRAPIPPLQLNASLPAELERIIGKCLEKDRELRYQHASEIRADLERLKQDMDSARLITDARHGTGVSKRWRTALIATVAIAGLGIGRLPLLPPRAQTHRQRHDCSRRFHQQDRRYRLRPDAPARIGRGTGSIAFLEPRPGSTHPGNSATDGPASGFAANRRCGAGGLRANVQRRRRAGVDLQAGEQVCAGLDAPAIAAPARCLTTNRFRSRGKRTS